MVMSDQSHLEKYITLGDDYSLDAGESRVVKLAQTSRGLEVDDRRSVGQHRIKTAAAEEALAECHNVKAVPGRVYALVIGLGASEFWGVNNNGDAFPEKALLGLPPADTAMSFFDKFKARIRPGWGYKTFLKGHVFEEHRNTNPKLAIGGIQNTFWNNRMHRVENLIWIDRTKGKKWADRLDNGATIGTSMAARVPFDRCSICQNLAPTRAQYCVHIKPGTSAYSLRQIREDGTPVCMINDFPHFFDESCVETPAAPEALSIMKVAREQTRADVRAASGGALPKAAKIEKQGPDLPLDVVLDEFQTLYQNEPVLPTPVLDKLRHFSLDEVTTGLAKLGMCLRPSELYYVAFGSDALTPKLAFELDQAVVYVPPVDGWRDSIADNAQVKFARKNFANVERVINLVRPFAEKRSYIEPFLTPRRMRAPVVKAASLRVNLDSGLLPYLAVYHGVLKKASGEFGYGAPHLRSAYLAAYGDE